MDHFVGWVLINAMKPAARREWDYGDRMTERELFEAMARAARPPLIRRILPRGLLRGAARTEPVRPLVRPNC